MYDEPVPLSFKEQVEKFKSKQMIIEDKDLKKAEKKIQDIGYYKLKEFAYPLSKVNEKKERIYPNVRFQTVVNRYYADKNLRIALLHSIEDIEVSFKTKLSYVLGKNGAYNYLKFNYWCNKDKFCKYYLSDKEQDFKANIRKKIKRSASHEIKNKDNINAEGFPSIWLLVDVLTFGDLLWMLKLMSKRNQKEIANFYCCTPNELYSWLKCLNYIRNICAHNSIVIDSKLVTTPVSRDEWKEYLYELPSSEKKVTDRIAIVLCIIKCLMKNIDVEYNFAKIFAPLDQVLLTDRDAMQLGFKSKKSLSEIFPKKKNKSMKLKR